MEICPGLARPGTSFSAVVSKIRPNRLPILFHPLFQPLRFLPLPHYFLLFLQSRKSTLDTQPRIPFMPPAPLPPVALTLDPASPSTLSTTAIALSSASCTDLFSFSSPVVPLRHRSSLPEFTFARTIIGYTPSSPIFTQSNQELSLNEVEETLLVELLYCSPLFPCCLPPGFLPLSFFFEALRKRWEQRLMSKFPVCFWYPADFPSIFLCSCFVSSLLSSRPLSLSLIRSDWRWKRGTSVCNSLALLGFSNLFWSFPGCFYVLGCVISLQKWIQWNSFGKWVQWKMTFHPSFSFCLFSVFGVALSDEEFLMLRKPEKKSLRRFLKKKKKATRREERSCMCSCSIYF